MFTGTYRQHNAALKWLRGTYEDNNDPWASPPTTFSNTEVTAVAALLKTDGMEYDFDADDMRSWSWMEMVAQLDDASMEFVVIGEGRSRGLVGCDMAIRPGSYDHSRHHQFEEGGRIAAARHGYQGGATRLPTWDFVLRREDGSAIRLHPQWSTLKVLTFLAEGHAEPVEPPKAGLGKSDGRGTYKKYKDMAQSAL